VDSKSIGEDIFMYKGGDNEAHELKSNHILPDAIEGVENVAARKENSSQGSNETDGRRASGSDDGVLERIFICLPCSKDVCYSRQYTI
jgi:hypothetical protein